MKIRSRGGTEKVELMMTPMIDIVFQLLIFFIMSFKIAAQEGDFNIKMPLSSAREGTPEENKTLPLKLRLRANPDGQLASIMLNDQQSFGTNFGQLRSYVVQTYWRDSGPSSDLASAEVELECDSELHYGNVIRTVTAVSGFVNNGRIVKLIEKIKFAPPKGNG